MKYNFQGVYSNKYAERIEFETEAEAREYATFLAGNWNDKVFGKETGEGEVLFTVPQPAQEEKN